jgi:exodeoxyribonuclease-3
VRFGALSIASVYLPSGSSGDVRQEAKYRCLEEFSKHLNKLKKADRQVVLCGDFNIAHRPIDIKNWKGNLKNSGFLPEERAWLDRLFDQDGWVDAFRVVNEEPDQYTWWSNRGQAYAKNVGWRIDYHIVTDNLREKIQSAEIYKAQKFSDHAPLMMDYRLTR